MTPTRFTRRQALRLLSMATGMSLSAACQPVAPNAAPTPAPAEKTTLLATNAAAVDQPRSGGILRQGNPGDLPTLDGNFLNGQSTIYPVWDRLVELDPHLNPLTDYATVMQIYQQDLAKIGLNLTLKPTEPVAFVDQTYNSRFPNLASGATLYGNLRPGFFAGNVYYSPFNNWSSFRSDRLRQLTDGLLHETDAAKQKQIYVDWIDYIQDESWAMPWSNTAPRFMHSAKVHGVRWNLADYMMTNDAWLSA